MILPIKSYFHNYGRRQRYVLPDSSMHSVRLSVQRGFIMRNNYEYDYCKSVGGKVYFLTFTYNDNSVLSIDGINFCNNNAFRQLMINKVYKTLERKFNVSCRYFCVGELGDGKGVRGYNNNPHLHVIFYLYPNEPKYYKKRSRVLSKYLEPYTSVDSPFRWVLNSRIPDSDEFMELCSSFWYGDTSLSAKNARYGILSYSTRGAEVTSYDALSYVCKYTIKDNYIDEKFNQLYDLISSRLGDLLVCYDGFVNLDINSVGDFVSCFYDSFDDLVIDSCSSFEFVLSRFRCFCYDNSVFIADFSVFHRLCILLARRFGCYLLPKVLISNGLGLSMLKDSSIDWTSPKAKIKTGDKATPFKYFPIPLYIYRKKFCTTEIYYKENRRCVRYIKNKDYEKLFVNNKAVFDARLKRSVDNLYSLVCANRNISRYRIEYFLSSVGVPYHPTSARLKNISYDDCFLYVAYMSVYFGRSAEIHFKDVASLRNIVFGDWRFFYYSDRDAKLSYLPFYDDTPYYSDFRKYDDVLNLLYNFELFLKYFKNEELTRKNSIWRQTHRRICVAHNQVNP